MRRTAPQEIIDALWKPPQGETREVICGNWLEYFSSTRYDLTVGDGVHCSLNPDEQELLFRKSYDLLEKGGLSIFRFFVLTKQRTPESLYNDLQANKIGSFHLFKILLAMSLQKKHHKGVKVADVFRTWQTWNIDISKLIDKTGWSKEEIETISFYKDKDTIYYFATLEDFLSMAEKYFKVEDVKIPDYQSGNSFPTVILRKTS